MTSNLPFLFLFFPALVFCFGAHPADQRVVKEGGIEYRAAESVSEEAFERAQFVVQQMTSASPRIREKMVSIGFKVEIIGKDQVLSDLPDYAHLKGQKTRDGRDFNTGTRPGWTWNVLHWRGKSVVPEQPALSERGYFRA